jgi:hypothetical protein
MKRTIEKFHLHFTSTKPKLKAKTQAQTQLFKRGVLHCDLSYGLGKNEKKTDPIGGTVNRKCCTLTA